MDEIKNLDDVLEYLYRMGFANISETELQKNLKKIGFDFSDKMFIGGDNSMSRLGLILEKLHNDGYIDRWTAKTQVVYVDSGTKTIIPDRMLGKNATKIINEQRVRIRYEGIILTKEGGYKGRIESLSRRKIWEDGIQEASRLNGERLNDLTLALVIGTLLLFSLEFVKFLCDYLG